MDHLKDDWIETNVLCADEEHTISINKSNTDELVLVTRVFVEDEKEKKTVVRANEQINTIITQRKLTSFFAYDMVTQLDDSVAMEKILPFDRYLLSNNLKSLETKYIVEDFLGLLKEYELLIRDGIMLTICEENLLYAQSQFYLLGVPELKDTQQNEILWVREFVDLLQIILAGRTLPPHLIKIIEQANDNQFITIHAFARALDNLSFDGYFEEEDEYDDFYNDFDDDDFGDNFDPRYDSMPTNEGQTGNKRPKSLLKTLLFIAFISIAAYMFYENYTSKKTMENESMQTAETSEELTSPTEEVLEEEFPDVSDGLGYALFYLDAMQQGMVLDRFAHVNDGQVYYRYVDEGMLGLGKMNVETGANFLLLEMVAPFNIVSTKNMVYYIDIMKRFSVCQIGTNGGNKKTLPFQASSFDLIGDNFLAFNDLTDGNKLKIVNLEDESIVFVDEDSVVQLIQTDSKGNVYYTMHESGLKRYTMDSQELTYFDTGDIHSFSIDEEANLLLFAEFPAMDNEEEYSTEDGPCYKIDLATDEIEYLGDFASFIFTADKGTIYYSGVNTEFELLQKDYFGNDIETDPSEDPYQMNYYRILEDVHYFAKMNGRLYISVDGKVSELPGIDYIAKMEEAMKAEQEAQQKAAEESEETTEDTE